MGEALGEYGAVAVRRITTSDETFEVGDPISPETCMRWGLRNRIALRDNTMLRFVQEPIKPVKKTRKAKAKVAVKPVIEVEDKQEGEL